MWNLINYPVLRLVCLFPILLIKSLKKWDLYQQTRRDSMLYRSVWWEKRAMAWQRTPSRPSGIAFTPDTHGTRRSSRGHQGHSRIGPRMYEGNITFWDRSCDICSGGTRMKASPCPSRIRGWVPCHPVKQDGPLDHSPACHLNRHYTPCHKIYY